MHITASGLSAASDALAFAHAERKHCLSDREWRFRLKGYGYDIRKTDRGARLTTLIGGHDLGGLDA
jgi:hypothetical protein